MAKQLQGLAELEEGKAMCGPRPGKRKSDKKGRLELQKQSRKLINRIDHLIMSGTTSGIPEVAWMSL